MALKMVFVKIKEFHILLILRPKVLYYDKIDTKFVRSKLFAPLPSILFCFFFALKRPFFCCSLFNGIKLHSYLASKLVGESKKIVPRCFAKSCKNGNQLYDFSFISSHFFHFDTSQSTIEPQYQFGCDLFERIINLEN